MKKTLKLVLSSALALSIFACMMPSNTTKKIKEGEDVSSLDRAIPTGTSELDKDELKVKSLRTDYDNLVKTRDAVDKELSDCKEKS
mgnify:CR=1 FL=1